MAELYDTYTPNVAPSAHPMSTPHPHIKTFAAGAAVGTIGTLYGVKKLGNRLNRGTGK